MKYRRRFILKFIILSLFFFVFIFFNIQLDNLSYICNIFENDLVTSSLSEEHILSDYRYKRILSNDLDNCLFAKQANFNLPNKFDIIRDFQKKCYYKNYSAYPLFPEETIDSSDDRIWNQMRFRPTIHDKDKRKHISSSKSILLYNGIPPNTQSNSSLFDNCPIKSCFIHDNTELSAVHKSDLVLWMHSFISQPLLTAKYPRRAAQIWMVYLLEAPPYTPEFHSYLHGEQYNINWTASYRHESTIVTPYFKFTPFNLKASSYLNQSGSRNVMLPDFAQNKSKMVAWFVSNCASINNRLSYAMELKKYIQVDIYGECGDMSCPKDSDKCFAMLRNEYRFYLAFENTNCREYITEKFFRNALNNSVVPIVMGAGYEDYLRVAPPHSFIHVDSFANGDVTKGPKLLARYLHYLSTNHSAYNEYLAWTVTHNGLIDTNTFFWCRLCSLLHESENAPRSSWDIDFWWFQPGICNANY